MKEVAVQTQGEQGEEERERESEREKITGEEELSQCLVF